MPVFFEAAADVSAPDTYKKKIKAALTKVGGSRERFTYYEQFKFDNGTRAALIPGKLDPAVAKDLAKKGAKPAQGFCTFGQETGLELVVTKGYVDSDKVEKSLKTAGVTCKVNVREGTAQDAELEKMSDEGTVSEKVAAFGDTLEAHLAGRTAEDREAKARLALEMGERAANAGKGENEPHAHSLSAHGPGVDQTPRIVSGHRGDQVSDDRAAGTLPADITLTAKDGRTADVPGYTTTGDASSTVSGAFGSATAMLAAVQEAFAQVAQLESFIAKELKHAKNEARVMAEPAVRDALTALVAVRKDLDAAKAKLPAKNPREADVAEVTRLAKALDTAAQAFKDAKDTAMAALPKNEPTELGDKRFVRSVDPGMATGTSYATTEPKLEKGQPIDQAAMTKRLDAMTTTEGVTGANVILDPAYVTNKDGTKSRAGWQAQTAFPTAGTDDRPVLDQNEYVVQRMTERKEKAAELAKAAQAKVDQLRDQEKEHLKVRKAADLAHGTANDRVFEIPNGTPVPPDLQQAVNETKQVADAAKKDLDDTRAALTNAQTVLATAKKAVTDTEAALSQAKKRMDKADATT